MRGTLESPVFAVAEQSGAGQKAAHKFKIYFPLNFEIIVKIIKARRFIATIVEPTGVPDNNEIRRPATAQITETEALQIVTDLNVLKSRIAESDGNITRALIRREPTRFMASTIITAIIMAITRL